MDPFANNPNGSGFYFNGIADLSGNVAGLLIPADQVREKKNFRRSHFAICKSAGRSYDIIMRLVKNEIGQPHNYRFRLSLWQFQPIAFHKTIFYRWK